MQDESAATSEAEDQEIVNQLQEPRQNNFMREGLSRAESEERRRYEYDNDVDFTPLKDKLTDSFFED